MLEVHPTIKQQILRPQVVKRVGYHWLRSDTMPKTLKWHRPHRNRPSMWFCVRQSLSWCGGHVLQRQIARLGHISRRRWWILRTAGPVTTYLTIHRHRNPRAYRLITCSTIYGAWPARRMRANWDPLWTLAAKTVWTASSGCIVQNLGRLKWTGKKGGSPFGK